MYHDLYQEILMDHYKNPRNKKNLDYLSDQETHENSLCGDSVKIEIDYDKKTGMVKSVFFDGRGCAVFTSATSIMTEVFENKPVEEIRKKIVEFISWLRGEGNEPDLYGFEEIKAFEGLIQYPVRIKCATLSWHALEKELGKL
ncbi:MAG: SUF system NifU family Fe-S cluster assembly protein [Spirochaetales bacterium]|nr:SUF system NifU family Fe-S cluster assembly protein [Spirochaetales bacterium]